MDSEKNLENKNQNVKLSLHDRIGGGILCLSVISNFLIYIVGVIKYILKRGEFSFLKNQILKELNTSNDSQCELTTYRYFAWNS